MYFRDWWRLGSSWSPPNVLLEDGPVLGTCCIKEWHWDWSRKDCCCQNSACSCDHQTGALLSWPLFLLSKFHWQVCWHSPTTSQADRKDNHVRVDRVMPASLWSLETDAHISPLFFLSSATGTINLGHRYQPGSCWRQSYHKFKTTWSVSLVTSVKFCPRQRDCCVTRKELLAVMALKHFHQYLYGRKVILRMDNSAVSLLRSLKAPPGQRARWLERVAEYNLEVTHRAGRSHGNSDVLSWLPCYSCKHQQCLNQKVIREEGLDWIAFVSWWHTSSKTY